MSVCVELNFMLYELITKQRIENNAYIYIYNIHAQMHLYLI